MAADPKARRIALLMMGKPSGPGGPPDDEDSEMRDESGDDELVSAVADFREALKGSDDEALAAAFRHAVSAAS